MNLGDSPAFQLKVNSNAAMAIIYIFMVLLAIIVLLPLLWLLSSSLKTPEELSINVWGLPSSFNLENFVLAWTRSEIPRSMINSAIVALVNIILTALASATIAYVLARLRFRANRIIYYIIIAGMMIPIHSAVIPLYILAMDLGLQNNLVALGVIYAAFRIPVSVFLLESFMKMIPYELEEAAIIDGCGYWGRFYKIILPLSKEGLITVLILAMLSSWNEMLIALLMLSRPAIQTLPISVMGFVTEHHTEYTQLSAGLLIACIPNILFYIFMQDKIIKGMTLGAVKG